MVTLNVSKLCPFSAHEHRRYRRLVLLKNMVKDFDPRLFGCFVTIYLRRGIEMSFFLTGALDQIVCCTFFHTSSTNTERLFKIAFLDKKASSTLQTRHHIFVFSLAYDTGAIASCLEGPQKNLIPLTALSAFKFIYENGMFCRLLGDVVITGCCSFLPVIITCTKTRF